MFSHFPDLRVKESDKGFTLIEVLLVISILTILAAATIIAINPSRQLEKSRDAERTMDVYTILSAIHQYANEHEGTFPEEITETNLEICRQNATDCSGLYDISVLLDNQDYLITIPLDPLCEHDEQYCSSNGTGYDLSMTENGKVTVSAPNTEGEDVITVTR